MSMHRQLFQDLYSGKVELIDVPDPVPSDNQVLIRNHFSVISPGTEKMLLEFGKASLLGKALRQPERVKEVLRKVASDGLVETYGAVQSRIGEPLALGYSSTGEVIAVGCAVRGISVGDRVASNAPHSEVALVSKNFVVKVPDQVSPEEAAFVTLGSVSMQAVRLAKTSVGESVVVIGAGIVGLMAGQILMAAGCRTVVLDVSKGRLELARSFGLETVLVGPELDAIEEVQTIFSSEGADAVLIATSSDDDAVLRMAASVARKRARIILIGTAGMTLARSDFYEKELSFQVSSSYGPGRNDPHYESGELDYPRAYVRWSANQNMRSVVRLMETGSLQVKPLITDTFGFSDAVSAYQKLSDPRVMTISLAYGSGKIEREQEAIQSPSLDCRVRVVPSDKSGTPLRINVLGAGNFSRRTLLPVLAKKKLDLGVVASKSGPNAAHLRRKFGFEEASADSTRVIADRQAQALFLTTRHDTHARYTVEALRAGLSVYVEKPLALSREELDNVRNTLTESKENHPGVILAVGFNRRFSPYIVEAKRLLENINSPKAISIRVNGGSLSEGHWVLDAKVGGGRILSEGVHFIDLARCLVGKEIVGWTAVGSNKRETGDSVITLVFADSSVATIEYLVSSSRKLRKERIEISSQGKSVLIDNFRRIQGFGWTTRSQINSFRQDKGHSSAVDAFLLAASGRATPPIPYEEIFEVSGIAIDIAQKLLSKEVAIATWQKY